MAHRQWVILGLLLAALCASEYSVLIAEPSEQLYQDKPLSAWVAILKDTKKDPYVRAEAAHALAHFGKPAVGPLIEALKERNVIYFDAVASLSKIGPEANAAVPTLMDAMNDSNCFVAAAAIRALGGIGIKAKTALPRLLSAAKSSNPYVSSAAGTAVMRINQIDQLITKAMTEARSVAGTDPVQALELLRRARAALDADPVFSATKADLPIRDEIDRLVAEIRGAQQRAEQQAKRQKDLAAAEQERQKALAQAELRRQRAVAEAQREEKAFAEAEQQREKLEAAADRAFAEAEQQWLRQAAQNKSSEVVEAMRDRALAEARRSKGPAEPARLRAVAAAEKDHQRLPNKIKTAQEVVPALLAEQYLHSGELAKGTKALQAALVTDPKNDQVRFGLGVIQFLSAIQRFGQALHLYGVRDENKHLPFFRLPVPQNPQPAPISYAALRRVLDDCIRDLALAEGTLASVTDPQVKLPLRLAHVRLDLAGDGNAADKLMDIMKKIIGVEETTVLKYNPDFLVCFDRGDVAWLRGYCHLLSGMLDLYLAIDTEEFFDLFAYQFFAKPNYRPHRGDADERKRSEFLGGQRVVEPVRLGRFRRHMIKVAELNRETWRHIRAETDDDHEWLPNPRQKGVLGLRVQEGMIDAWLDAVGEVEALLYGTKTLPRELFERRDGKVPNLRALLEDPPPRFHLESWFATLPDKYWMPQGKKVDFLKLWRVLEVFGNNPSGYAYAVWFN